MDQEALRRAENRFNGVDDVSKRAPYLRFDVEPPPRLVSIEWRASSMQISCSCERKVRQVLVRRGEFGRLEGARLREVELALRGTRMSLAQARSLRSQLLRDKVVRLHHVLVSRADELLAMYQRGTDVLQIAREIDAPPVNVMRQILIKREHASKDRVRRMLKERSKMLNERDRQQLALAEANDICAATDQRRVQRLASLFEGYLERNLRDEPFGLRFKTEEQLRVEKQAMIDDDMAERDAERPSKELSNLPTPDILIVDNLVVNGVAIAWIDAKMFYGCLNYQALSKTRKTINRYSGLYGTGAIFYSLGCSQQAVAKHRNALVLDPSLFKQTFVDYVDEVGESSLFDDF
jgi:Protein of unknown function TPD sequence-motif